MNKKIKFQLNIPPQEASVLLSSNIEKVNSHLDAHGFYWWNISADYNPKRDKFIGNITNDLFWIHYYKYFYHGSRKVFSGEIIKTDYGCVVEISYKKTLFERLRLATLLAILPILLFLLFKGDFHKINPLFFPLLLLIIVFILITGFKEIENMKKEE